MNSNSRNFSAAQAQRLRHYRGQRLSAADLQDEYDNQSCLRVLTFPDDLPNAPDGYNLVMRYDVDLGQLRAQLDGALCRPKGDHPAFAWQRPDQTRLGRDVPLLRVLLLDG